MRAASGLDSNSRFGLIMISMPLPLPDNPRKLALRERVDATLDEIESWRRFNAAYHDDDRKFMRFLIPPGKRTYAGGVAAVLRRRS